MTLCHILPKQRSWVNRISQVEFCITWLLGVGPTSWTNSFDWCVSNQFLVACLFRFIFSLILPLLKAEKNGSGIHSNIVWSISRTFLYHTRHLKKYQDWSSIYQHRNDQWIIFFILVSLKFNIFVPANFFIGKSSSEILFVWCAWPSQLGL